MSVLHPFVRSSVAHPAWGLSLVSLLVLSACGGSDDPTTGSMRLALTDTPACGFDHVYVTVLGAKVHKDANAVDSDAGWYNFTLPSTPQRRCGVRSASR